VAAGGGETEDEPDAAPPVDAAADPGEERDAD
jgi:hypothetical protein